MESKKRKLQEIDNAPKPIPLDLLRKHTVTLPKSICLIKCENKIGTGILIKIESLASVYCLITSINVFSPISHIFAAIIKFEECDYFRLELEWIVIESLKPLGQGDYFAIELKEKAVVFLEAKGLCFLKLREPKIGEQILVVGYSDDDISNPNPKLVFAHGVIQTIIGCTISYNAATAPSTSGSPLILWSGEAIGVCRLIKDEYSVHSHTAVGSQRFATSLAEIRKNFLSLIGKLSLF